MTTDQPTTPADRHPATVQLMRWFDFGYLPEGVPRSVAGDCFAAAYSLAAQLSDGPELTTGLRKLLEAKDCFVRAAIAQRDGGASE